MTQRYKITAQITTTLSGDYETVAIAAPDDQGDFVRYDAVSHLTEEKTLEQHRAEFEANWEYIHSHGLDGGWKAVAWAAWKAAKKTNGRTI